MKTCGACGQEMTAYGVRSALLRAMVHADCVADLNSLSPNFIGRYAHARALSTVDLRLAVRQLGLKVTLNGSYRDRTWLRYQFAAATAGTATQQPRRDMPSSTQDLRETVARLQRNRDQAYEELNRVRLSNSSYVLELTVLRAENARLCAECKALREQNEKLMGRAADPVVPMEEMSRARFAGLEVK